jgi:hypothetical protein
MDVRIILRRILNRKGVSVLAGFSCARIGPVAGSVGYGNEPSNSINGGEFIDKLSDYRLLKKDSAP